MKRRCQALIILLFLILLTIGSYHENITRDNVIRNISYIQDEEKCHMLNLHGVQVKKEAKPVIIEIHGGALVQGDKKWNGEYCDFLAEQGFVVVDVNYTLLQDGDLETIVQDLVAVLRWVTEHAQVYQMDASHIYLDGDSAGGYLSGLMAAVLTQKNLQAYYHVNTQGLQVKGYAMGCPMISLDYLIGSYEMDGLRIKDPSGAQHVDMLLSKEGYLEHSRLMDIIDPATYPEVYILTTPEDDEIYEDALELHNYLTSQNISHQYVEYKGIEEPLFHTFNAIDPNRVESIQANLDKVQYFLSME